MESWGFGGSRSGRSSGSGGSGEIEEESISGREAEGEEEKVYVAVAKELKKGKATLQWALQNGCGAKRLVILHVHRPAQMIPMMGAMFPVSQLKEQQVRAYRQDEREKMHKSLDGYMIVCSQLKVQAEKLVIEADDIGKGLLEAISRHGITKLVIGAAADKHYSKKMKVPKSKTAITLKQQADPSCKIWFVCKGNLICTREAFLDSSGVTLSPASSPRSILSQEEQLRSRPSPQGQSKSLGRYTNFMQDPSRYSSSFENFDSHGGGTKTTSPVSPPLRTPISRSRFSTEGSFTDPWQASSSLRSSQSSNRSLWSATDEVPSNSSSISIPDDEDCEEGSIISSSVQGSDEGLHFLSPYNELEDTDGGVYDKLKEALAEAEQLRDEAYKESRRRQKAERELIEIIQKGKLLENLHAKETKQRKQIEEALARQEQEVEMLKHQRDELFEQLQSANTQKLALELHIADSDNNVNDIKENLAAAQHLLYTLRREHEELQLERDAAVREAEELRSQKEQVTPTSTHGLKNFSEFTYSEIEQASHNFSSSMKIGEGGYGSVYKGFIRNTPVAIKMMNPKSVQGQSEFHQEVDVLCRVRHPNLVTLIGVCPEAWALIYEYLPNGSLEDRLDCKNNSSPLAWQVRTRIAADICSALIFLHSNRPHPVVHGDLKPANVLLDANLTSKLGDFGICRLLVQSSTSNTFYHHTHPKGTFIYMDPEFLTTGELTPHSDVYSFGIIILQLLTGRPALGIIKQVQEALDKGLLHGMIDPTAGNWPFVQAKQLAHLGLRCCEVNRKKRPDLVGEAWRVIEPMLKTASFSMSPFSFSSVADDNSCIPNHFICPIFQEVMRDPHIAADGFTYEAEALKGWFDSGHNTSPMTNLRLPNCELIPNRALRSAIQEWMQQEQQS